MTSDKKKVRHFDVGGSRFTHKANWDHIGKVLAVKAKLRNSPLEEV